MAEEETAAKGLGILKQKVGPLPLGIWLVAGLAVWWFVGRKQAANTSGVGTDPAGNTGVIDPATGYVYGTPSDTAALSGSGTADTTANGSTTGTTTATYADNNAWGRAAVNYLVGIGVDPTQANEAIQQFLASQSLTSAQQGDVNLAIQALGPPPTLPGPVNQPPGTITTPPGGGTGTTVYASNPPTGLHVVHKYPTSVQLSWNKVANATGYLVTHGTHGQPGSTSPTTAPASQAGITIGGLKPGTAYWFRVWAQPTKGNAPYASTSTTTPKA